MAKLSWARRRHYDKCTEWHASYGGGHYWIYKLAKKIGRPRLGEISAGYSVRRYAHPSGTGEYFDLGNRQSLEVAKWVAEKYATKVEELLNAGLLGDGI